MMKQEHSFAVTNFFQPKNLISECFELIGVAILNIGLSLYTVILASCHVFESKPFFFLYCIYVSIPSLSSDTPEEIIGSHYRWL